MNSHLSSLANKYECADFLNGDPSWFMHQVKGDTNREILAFIASSISYGSRKQFLPKIDAPMIILWNEDRMLLEYVETLQDNGWNGRPVINRYNTANPDEEPEWEEEVRKSLKDIHYSLLDYKRENEPFPAE